MSLAFTLAFPTNTCWDIAGCRTRLRLPGVMSGLLVGLLYRQQSARAKTAVFFYLLLCTASHGLLDAMTDGGLGVAFFSPLDTTRYFFSFRPAVVSPIGIGKFVG